MWRANASLVESCRLFYEADFITESDMDARIKREPFPPSPEMLLGTAFHAACEGTGTTDRVDGQNVIVSDGHAFSATDIAATLDHLEGEPEVPGEVVVMVQGGPMRITCRADYLSPYMVTELKTSAKPPDPLKHEPSMQWRVYALAYGVTRVRYVLVQLAQHHSGIYVVRDCQPVMHYRYRELARDVRIAAERLVDYAQTRGLAGYLEDRS